MGAQLSFVRAIPPVALVPPAIILIGIGSKMMITLSFFVAMWPIVLNVADGVREIDQTMRDTSQILRLSRLRKLRYQTLPAVAPRLFAGMHTALVFCIIGIVAVEYLSGTEGLGYLLQISQYSVDIPTMWAVILMLGLLGNIFNLLFNLLQRRVLYWKTDLENF
jgi:ABC-type nitrate/sulfonate/bicarbonate transport system permease component